MAQSASFTDASPAAAAAQPRDDDTMAHRLPLPAQYVCALVAVALASAVGLGMEGVIVPANLTLVYVLPVIVSAIAFGWGPSLFAAVTSAAAFDFFFTEPKYSLAIASPSDVWSTGLLLLIGAIVSTLAAQARRRALEAQKAAGRAKALQSLAHAVITSAPRQQIMDSAAAALSGTLGAPVAILARREGQMDMLASAGGARLRAGDIEAAGAALDVHTPTRAGAYPTDLSRFDFWPASLPGGQAIAVGIDYTRSAEGRSEATQHHVEAVLGYLAVAAR